MKEWTGRVVACIASGPSLTREDCEAARQMGWATVVTNTTFRLCPWADALFAFDIRWWKRYLPEVRSTFRGRLLTQWTSYIARDIECVRRNPGYLSFGNSGANAISLAVLSRASAIILLGYDCKFAADGRSHHHGDHPSDFPNCTTLPRWPTQFARVAAYAKRRKVPVFNATRDTALECFPRVTLEQAINDHANDVDL